MASYSSLRMLSSHHSSLRQLGLCSNNLIRNSGIAISSTTGRFDSYNGGIRRPKFMMFIRSLHSKKLSRNMEFITSLDKPFPKHPDNPLIVKQVNEENNPIVLLFCWLMCKDKHVKKYVKFYTDLGVDVLKIRISPFDLYRPLKGSQVVADKFLDFLHANPSSSPLLIHGFSVGAYVFCESMVKVANNMEKHGMLLDRFIGQIWDSPVDVDGIPTGMPRAITDNKILQTSMTKYLVWYLKTHYETATKHYNASSQKMHECFVNVPALLLFSKTDPISDDHINGNICSQWEKKGVPVFTKCWEKSPHVSHYHKHKKEYEAELHAFLERIGLIHKHGQRATSTS